MKTKTGLYLMSGILLSFTFLSSQALDRNVLKTIYGNYLRENGRSDFDLSKTGFKWEIGAFTAKGSRDAILKVEDMGNMSHADGWNKLFLLRYQNGWRLAEELESNDSIDYKVMDLQNDGIFEVWIESSHMGMGYLSTGAKLLSLSGGKASVLYENSGSDPSGAAGENDAYETESHDVSFKDIDRDGTMDLIDRHVTGKYLNRNYDASEVSQKTVETTFKLVDGRFVPWKAPMANTGPVVASGAQDPVEFAKREIERLNVLWTQVFYLAASGTYRIGGRIAMAGGGYLLLESPAIAVDMVTGGFYKAAATLTKDAALALIENAVRSPRKVCVQVAREVIDRGWSEYRAAYAIGKEYRKTARLSAAEAVEFLKCRDGAEKMALGKVLYEKSASAGHAVDQVLAEKAGRELTGLFAKKYQNSLGIEKTLPLAEAAFFIKDVHDVLKSTRTGLLAYPPYVDFSGKMEAINRRNLEEAKRYYPNSFSGGQEGPAEESFDVFFARFKKDVDFQLRRIEFPLKYIAFDPTADDDPGKTTLIERSEWQHQKFVKTETDLWGDPDVNGDEVLISYQRESTGIAIHHHFHRVSGIWLMWKIEDWSM